MKAVQGVPVVAFPCPAVVVFGEPEQGQDHFVDLVGVDIHGISLFAAVEGKGAQHFIPIKIQARWS